MSWSKNAVRRRGRRKNDGQGPAIDGLGGEADGPAFSSLEQIMPDIDSPAFIVVMASTAVARCG